MAVGTVLVQEQVVTNDLNRTYNVMVRDEEGGGYVEKNISQIDFFLTTGEVIPLYDKK